VDLTFATRLAASSEGECQIGTPPQLSKAATQKVRARMAGYGVGDDEKKLKRRFANFEFFFESLDIISSDLGQIC
jgi:hypothetical protein